MIAKSTPWLHFKWICVSFTETEIPWKQNIFKCVPHLCLLFMTPTVVWPLRRGDITENIAKYNIICVVAFG